MSDESDETRRVPPVDDSTIPGERLDDTLPDNADLPPATSPDDDATKVVPAASDADDATKVVPAASAGDDATAIDATRVGQDDDWAASRANPVWSGRAEVRSPRPGRPSYETDWADTPPPVPVQRDRWWMPIVVGIIVLILLGVLAWAIYLIVQNSGGDQTPAPVPSTTVATTNPPSTAPSTAPSTEPSTTVPTTTATTQQPTASITVPALKGLSLAEARAALNRMGLRYRVLPIDSTAAPGTVIDSDPAEGQEVPPDTRITIVVAQQSTATTTPTTTGPTSATATATETD